MASGSAHLQRGPGRKLAAIAALLVVLIVAVLWLQRRDLAQGYADDLLRQRGVPARYTIAELGFGGQRLTGVTLGDPARPDLTADWIETRTTLTFSGPRVTAIRAGSVRLRGRIVGGRVSLGAIDRLLPAAGGAPFALPDIDLSVTDGRMRLDTAAGPVGLKLAGSGGLQDGFRGQLAAVGPQLALAGCAVEHATAYGALAIRRGAPRFAGPVRAAAVRCGATRAAGVAVALDATLGPALDRWQGQAAPSVADLRGPGLWLKGIDGKVRFAGDAAATGGTLTLAAGRSAVAGASAAALRADGDFRLAATLAFAGRVAAEHASLPTRWRVAAAGLRGAAAGSPAGPLLDRLAGALARAARDAAVDAQLTVAGATVRVRRLDARSVGGAALGFGGGRGFAIGAGGSVIDGVLTLAGGGLPEGQIAVTQADPGAPLIGTARFADYRAGNASLALTPVAFRATPGGRTFFATRATLSGPLGASDGGGRVERATLPVEGGWDGRGRLVLNPGCARAGFRTLRVAGLTLDPASLTLCPVGRALVTIDHGRLSGGAGVAAPRLTGRLGGSPLLLAARGSEVRFGDGGVGIDGLSLRLGAGAAVSRLDLASLTGRIAGGGIAGRYAGGAGRIGAAPLLASDAAGEWRLQGGALALTGALTVADAADAPRFVPLPARGLQLSLRDGVVRVTGGVFAPGRDTTVADIAIRHRLADGIGSADLIVPGVTFGDGLQPNDLTRLTLGVIADVKGTISGRGRIDWTPRGVTSTGDFRTAGVDLAAAFGPVTGVQGAIHFTDLLALASAPGQRATVAGINPGVPVLNGVVRYQLLAGPMVRVEDARWPFAGGELTLEPTLLDYSRAIDKRMTFRIDGLDAAVFLQNFDYRNLTATGSFDGALPMVFDDTGGRIERGRLRARSGGTLAYVGEVSQENLGVWGNLAFGALKSLRYRSLDLTLYGPLGGEIVTEAKFAGIAQGVGAKTNFITRRIARLPFVFNVKITAPFRSLLDSARGFYDPGVAIQRNLPALIDQQKKLVQPSASVAAPEEKPH